MQHFDLALQCLHNIQYGVERVFVLIWLTAAQRRELLSRL
jgi:hypothetical protein